MTIAPSATWHVITGEYPPQPGGVSDYTLSVARGIAETGAKVHVWCPQTHGATPDIPGVTVHRVAGNWNRADFQRVDRQLDQLPGPRRLLVQWVPQAFGHRSLNLGFCRWIRRRAQQGDSIDVMVHEAFLAFIEGSWRQDIAAAVHRVMVTVLLSRATRIWVSIPAWGDSLRPYCLGRRVEFGWLPVPSNIPFLPDAQGAMAVRDALAPSGAALIGHFGTYGRHLRTDLDRLVPALIHGESTLSVVLMGRDSDAFRTALVAAHPTLSARVHATGRLDARTLSTTLQACDLVVQPYPDGASSRRGTLMAALAHGVPVVTTNGRLSETIWRGSGAVRLVAAGDLSGLARAALDLCANPEERRRLGAAGQALYARLFDLANTIQALVSEGRGPRTAYPSLAAEAH